MTHNGENVTNLAPGIQGHKRISWHWTHPWQSIGCMASVTGGFRDTMGQLPPPIPQIRSSAHSLLTQMPFVSSRSFFKSQGPRLQPSSACVTNQPRRNARCSQKKKNKPFSFVLVHFLRDMSSTVLSDISMQVFLVDQSLMSDSRLAMLGMTSILVLVMLQRAKWNTNRAHCKDLQILGVTTCVPRTRVSRSFLKGCRMNRFVHTSRCSLQL